MFYMKVQIDNIRGSSQYSARPSISDPGVYILDFVHSAQMIKGTIKKDKKGGSSTIAVKAININ